MIETKIFSGVEVSSSVYAELKPRIQKLLKRKITPGLAAILVGEDPSSKLYVQNKSKRFQSLGLYSQIFYLPTSTTFDNIVNKISELNLDHNFHGILVQQPLPKDVDLGEILESINPKKDVDGFHPENMGLLASGINHFIPCTPKGIIRIFKHYKIQTSGKNTVIIGRSNIVGRPLSLLLSSKSSFGNSTVTICHSKTKDLASITKQADILIASVGVPNLIKGNMIKEDSIIIDVGITRVNDNSKKGYSLIGDVDIKSVMGIANAVTPVPGGVGPMTIAMLVENTIEAAEWYGDSVKEKS
tara:strand:+ start:17438 stop:18337 length:900 start_codon:yes stop_codon:yes gene_type:complete